jgi:protein SCO1/2
MMREINTRLLLTATLLLFMVDDLAIRAAMATESAATGESAEQKDSDQHAMHHEMLTKSKSYQTSSKNYPIPDVNLVNMNGETISLRKVLDLDQPVLLNFIFTSCTTICPVLTATMAQAEKQLLNEPVIPKIISVSIDPEYDTPERLHEYAKSYRAGPDWDFLTGDTKSVISVQRAFDSYRGGKTNHVPITLLRASVDEPWLRLDGFTTAADLVREFREITLK